MFWYLCLSRLPKQRKIRVKIINENHVPKRGEELQIVGKFRHKENAEWVKRLAPKIKEQWGTMLFLTDETMYSYVPSPDGRGPDRR